MLNVQVPNVPVASGTPIATFQTTVNPAVLWKELPSSLPGDTIFNVVIYSHHFKVTPLTVIARRLCMDFVRRYVIVDPNSDDLENKAYVASNSKRSWFRYHINTLDEFKKFIYEKGYGKAASYSEKPLYTPTKVSLAIKDGWTHKPEQEPVRDYLAAPIGEKHAESGLYPEGTGARARLVGISTGAGKAQPLNAAIKVPGGWKTMGQMKIGDVITAWDGTDSKVLEIHPQGFRDIVTVTFEDGRSTECDRDHLWKVYKASGEWFIKTTDEIIRDREYARTEYFIDYRKPSASDVSIISRRFKAQVGALLRGSFNCFFDEENDIVDDVRALGGKASITKHPVFKGCKVVEFDLRPKDKLRLSDIKSAGKVECQCIKIDHPDRLYVTDGYIVTHNTFCSLAELVRRGEIFVAIVLAQFVPKWVKDISNTTKIKPSEILAIKGSESLKALTEMAVTQGSMKPYKAIVIANRTYENYLRAFERHEDDFESHGYMCAPDELFEKLGIGTRLIDEVHMQFYAQYRLDLYTHVPQSISLSATLVNKDPEIERIYRTAYPMAERYKEGPIDKFTDAYAVRYSVNPNWRYKTSYKPPSYSQNCYEESILKNRDFTTAYFKMIKHHMDIGYIRNYEPGNKAIVFCGTVAMCGELAKYLQHSYPNLNVKRHVAQTGKDKERLYEENYKKPDIRVTTIGSGGTGHDVPGLTDGHLTPGLESIQANIQALGRVRKIPGKQTRYWWYTNTDIQKHLKYDRSKMQLMRERAKSITPISYGTLY